MKSATIRPLGRDVALPFALYALLTLALTWPAARDFSSRLVSDGGDALNNLWMLWHVREVVAGQHHLFETPLLYYPAGVNLLSRGLGPVVGLLALPFWGAGAEAAYNGSLLLGFWLTGCAMYLLARGLGLGRRAALFAGLFLLVAPLHLAGVQGHMTKTFLALLPLALLALHQTLDPGRTRWWAPATAVLLALILFHNGYQFVYIGLAFAFFILARLLQAGAAQRAGVLRRAALLCLVVALVVGPLTLPFLSAAANPLVEVTATSELAGFQPDLLELFTPPKFSLLWGRATAQMLASLGIASSIESNVYLTWAGLILGLISWRNGPRRARPWLLFGLLCALLALGPGLKFLGQVTFTSREFAVPLPYALLAELPGFSFMRVSGRSMMIGYVALAVAAAYGLSWLMQRYPSRAGAIFPLALALLLLEVWPRPWPQESLRPAPDFYRQLAADDALYGVFDLPVKSAEHQWFAGYAAAYQRYQMVHGKGIASGYLARTYSTHPLFPCIIPHIAAPRAAVLVDGAPADCTQNMLFDLAHFDYRYVVLHKTEPGEMTIDGAWGREQARRFLDAYFAQQPPLVDDQLVRVYEVPPLPEAADGLSPTIGLLDNWYRAEGTVNPRRWARSPATIFLSTPRDQELTLALIPELMYEPLPEIEQVLGHHGRLRVAVNGELFDTVDLERGETTEIRLQLPAGVYTLSLALETGNFRPVDYDMSDDRRELSFMLRLIELRTAR